MERIGIAIAGNILTDNVKMIALYPEKGMLSTIESEMLAVGGCVPNTAIDLKKLDSNLGVFAFGKVGDDEKGKFVVEQMANVGVDVSGVKVSKNNPTSYSDVMTVKDTGERTFFHNRGANKEFCPQDIDVEQLNCKIFHIGYLMLLDYFDRIADDGSTPMSKLLKRLREKGIKTSIDIVSESSGNFSKVVKSALPHCDYVIINEIEAGAIVGIAPRKKDGKIDQGNVKQIMQKLMSFGIKEKLIVHCPEIGFCMNKDGQFTCEPSIKLPKGFIKGSVGAGDAFCAGSLYGIYNGYTDSQTLKFSNLVAVNCLSCHDSTSGVRSKDELNKVL